MAEVFEIFPLNELREVERTSGLKLGTIRSTGEEEGRQVERIEIVEQLPANERTLMHIKITLDSTSSKVLFVELSLGDIEIDNRPVALSRETQLYSHQQIDSILRYILDKVIPLENSAFRSDHSNLYESIKDMVGNVIFQRGENSSSYQLYGRVLKFEVNMIHIDSSSPVTAGLSSRIQTQIESVNIHEAYIIYIAAEVDVRDKGEHSVQREYLLYTSQPTDRGTWTYYATRYTRKKIHEISERLGRTLAYYLDAYNLSAPFKG
jgi:hypothetical protein